MQTVSKQILRKEFISKAEAIAQDLQQAVEGSFNEIDSQLDQILNNQFYLMQCQPAQQQSDLPQLNFNLLKQKNEDFLKQINSDVTSLIQCNLKKELQKKEKLLHDQYKETQMKLEQKIQDKNQENQQLKNSQTNQSSQILSNQSNLQQFNPLQLTFSQQFKHNNCQIQQNGRVVVETSNNVGWYSCICDQMIPKHGLVKFAFKILDNYQVMVGIGFRDIIQKNNNCSAHGIRKGTYYIFCNGYCYNHDQQDKDSKQISFKFTTNDIIIMEVEQYIKYNYSIIQNRFNLSYLHNLFQLQTYLFKIELQNIIMYWLSLLNQFQGVILIYQTISSIIV